MGLMRHPSASLLRLARLAALGVTLLLLTGCSNGQLVEKAIKIIELLGARALTPAEARRKLGLAPR